MLNDRDDKFEGHEESEYHFSEDDVSYEVEAEAAKDEHPPVAEQPKLINKLTKSKRTLISAIVFIILIFVVYKMVTPSSSTAPNSNMVATAAESTPKNTGPMSANQPPAATQQQANAQAMTQAQMAPAATQPAQMPAPVTQQQASAGMPQQIVPAAPGAPPTTAGMQPTQTAPGMPAMIPVGSTMPPQAIQSQATTTQQSQVIDTKLASITAENEKMMNQLQADYAQKLNDYQAQNKALLDQVSTLSSRVATLETELTQLLQMLSRQNQAANTDSNTPAAADAPSHPPTGSEITKTSYSVQAIIPGRAWLRADNGETLTVAEGDTVKELGRVTKIDPYDGIVEINTGNKVISLSYGTSG